MTNSANELEQVNRKAERHAQAIMAGAGLLSAVGHGVYVSGQEGSFNYVDEAKECEYEVNLMLDAIAERVVDEIERRRAKARRRKVAALVDG